MRRKLSLGLLVVVLIAGFALSALAETNPTNKELLKGVGKKEARKPSMSLLLRDDLKEEFKKVMTDYLKKDKDAYLEHFDGKLVMVGQKLYNKKVEATKDDLKKRVDKEYAHQEFNKIRFEDVFDMNKPSMMFVLSEEQMHDSIPVWNFAVEPKDIAHYMKPGDYLVIANTIPAVTEKVTLPTTIYYIFRKAGDKFTVVGMD